MGALSRGPVETAWVGGNLEEIFRLPGATAGSREGLRTRRVPRRAPVCWVTEPTLPATWSGSQLSIRKTPADPRSPVTARDASGENKVIARERPGITALHDDAQRRPRPPLEPRVTSFALMGGEAPHAAQIRSGARAPERGRPANDIDRPGAPRRRRAASSSEGGGARSFAAGGSRGSLLGFAARLRCSATGLRYWASLLGFAIDYRPT